jgi:hypothetical protein
MNEIVALTVGFTKEFIIQKTVDNLIIFAETIFWRRNYYRLWFLINSPFFNALFSKLKTFVIHTSPERMIRTSCW